jgi:3-hydroxyacyl-CoA dehydrogenase
MTTDYQSKDDVAVLSLNSPPVNGFNLPTRRGLLAGLERAMIDPAIRVIIITGCNGIFSGGADIREFDSPVAFESPDLRDLIQRVEECSKPVIAAINGTCIGGGLELALACHYRVALSTAKVGLPEIKLGLLPGAGGTQRLPRAVGLDMALKMILTGSLIASEALSATALFDMLTVDDPVSASIAFAQKIADRRPLPKISDIAPPLASSTTILSRYRDEFLVSSNPLPAIAKSIDAIEASLSMSMIEGLAYEKSMFYTLLQTTESKALRHVFFAQRAASKVSDLVDDTVLRPIASIAVIGAGTMGVGIVITFLNAGLGVIVLEKTQALLDRGIAEVGLYFDSQVQKGKVTNQLAIQILAKLRGTLSYADLSKVDLAIEAVFEDISLKAAVFADLDANLESGAIIASNTSTLDLDELAFTTNRPSEVVGLHFFSPAHIMRLLEIVRGRRTSDAVLATMQSLAKKIGKISVVSGVCDGFIGNRILDPYLRQAAFLLEEGCFPTQVDRAMEAFGFAMGPFRMADMAGNDIGCAVRKRRRLEKSVVSYSILGDLLCEAGRLGQKSGKGWYDYELGNRQPIPSPVVDDLIRQHSTKNSINRRLINDQEIVHRLVYALINEAANVLEDGTANRASDIDVVYITGYGFPALRGGPLFYADTIGLEQIVTAIDGFAKLPHPRPWSVSPLLKKLADQNGRFN